MADRWPTGAPSEVQPELERLKKIHERYHQFKPLTCEHIRDALRGIDPGLVVDVLASSPALLPEVGDRNSQLSFLSKYLHFCINDGFPIWDSNARLVLGGNAELTWASYKEWLSLVRQEVAKHRECLEQSRREQDQLHGESLVRTLDKALYIIGIRIVGSADAGELHVAVTLE